MNTLMRKVQNIICQFLFFGLIIFGKTSFAQSKRVDAETFAKLMKETTSLQLVDVRTPDEYGGGHLPKAQNLNVKDSDFENKLNKLDKNQPVFVYCLSGGRSRTAADILVKNGFKGNIYLSKPSAEITEIILKDSAKLQKRHY